MCHRAVHEAITRRDSNGHTLLQCAIEGRHLKMIDFLLKCGSRLSPEDASSPEFLTLMESSLAEIEATRNRFQHSIEDGSKRFNLPKSIATLATFYLPPYDMMRATGSLL